MVAWRSGVDGDAQLRADAVVGGDEDRIAEAGALQVEKAAEPAEVGIRASSAGRFGDALDGVDQRIAGIDVDAGIAVRDGRFVSVRCVTHGPSDLSRRC